MKNILWIVSMVLLTVPMLAKAEEKNGDFATNKAQILQEIDQRIQKLQQHKACVSAAKDHTAFLACSENMREWRKGEREERDDRRSDRKEERQNR